MKRWIPPLVVLAFLGLVLASIFGVAQGQNSTASPYSSLSAVNYVRYAEYRVTFKAGESNVLPDLIPVGTKYGDPNCIPSGTVRLGIIPEYPPVDANSMIRHSTIIDANVNVSPQWPAGGLSDPMSSTTARRLSGTSTAGSVTNATVIIEVPRS